MFLEFQSQVCKENTLIQEKKNKPDKDAEVKDKKLELEVLMSNSQHLKEEFSMKKGSHFHC